MTRAQRLELLKQIEKDIYVCSLESTFLDDAKSCAIHSVIEELKQEPCEDCISRERAEMCLTADITDMTMGEYISMVGKRLKALPSVQPKPRERKWIPLYDDDGTRTYEEYYGKTSECPFCGAVDYESKYCPNCGNRLEENEE